MSKEPKTKPTDASVADFIAAVENPARRADAEVLRAMMAEITGAPPVMWGPTIVGFGSYRGATGDWPVAGFSPRKANLVVYLTPGFDQTEPMSRLGKARTSVACLYINRLSDVDLGVLREMVEASVRETRAHYPDA